MEKSLLYCFTGTGNSLKVAKDIKDSIGECEIKSIKAGKSDYPEKYKRIGFIFPTYYFGLPTQVRKFLENLNIENNIGTDFFAVATCGGNTGIALETINAILKNKGAYLRYSNKVNMPDNYIFFYEAKPIGSEHKDYYKDTIDQINQDILQDKNVYLGGGNILYKFIYNISVRLFKNMDKKFKVTGCTSCRVCVNVCPSKNIVLENSEPKFNNKCEQCTACIQYCPVKAINYKDKTNNRKRYRNPSISFEERREFYN